jgi:hypothetical protein
MSQHFEKDELLSLDSMQPACNKKVVSLAFAQSFNLFHFTLFHKFCELKEVLASHESNSSFFHSKKQVQIKLP